MLNTVTLFKQDRSGVMKDEVEHSNLNSFLIFGIHLPHARLTIRGDALVDPVDNDQMDGFLLEATEGLEWRELVELTLQSPVPVLRCQVSI
jgi:hypothetical protein